MINKILYNGRFKNQINSILDNFDFKEVHRMMVKFGHTMILDHDEGSQVPSMNELKSIAKSMLEECESEVEPFYFVHRGRLRAQKFGNLLELFYMPEWWDEEINVNIKS